MPIVDVPGQGAVEFPDNMTDDQIASVIRQNMPAPTPERNRAAETGLGALAGLAGIGNTLLTPIRAGVQSVAPESGLAQYMQRMKQEPQNLADQYKDSNYFSGGKLGAEVAATLPVGGALGGALRSVPGAARVAPNLIRAAETSGLAGGNLATRAAGGALTGATQAALVEPESIGTGAALGAAFPLAGAAGGALGSRLAPRVTPQAQTLMREGIELTPGQIMGGIPKRIEDAAASIPIVGDAIRGAQTRTLQSFNRAVANRALGPIGEKLPASVSPGREAVGYVRNKLGQEYDNLLPTLQFKPDTQWAGELQNVLSMTNTPAFAKRDQFNAIVQQRLFDKITPQGNMSGETFKTVEEGLKKEAQSFLSSIDPDQRKLGEALSEVLSVTRQALLRSNPQQAPKLAGINAGYANYVRMRRAAGSVGAEDGIFTAAQLQGAVKASDRSVGKGAFARGDALMQDLSDAARATLPSSVPDSGTARRLMTGGALLGSLAIEPSVLLGAGLASLPYLPPGQRLTQNLLSQALAPRGVNGPAAAAAYRLATPLGLLAYDQ